MGITVVPREIKNKGYAILFLGGGSNDLPNSLRGAVPRMFADDTNLTLSAKTLTELKLALTPELITLAVG